MKFKILLFVFCGFLSLSLQAQNTYSVKGSIADTVSNVKLVNTSVSVLNAKDSILRMFTRAGGNGSFSISNLSKGKFILLVTYPGYADYVEPFTLDSAKTSHDFGKLNMILKAKLLADVIIKGTRAAIKIKGDTTEFDARAFKIQPNAKVEDLLKQLPGIQVDKDGKITAQGQTVNKVLVDGEEFFGDDPTLVTKNIRADMVDKVQLYDKKSDQATFTGIDDGQKTKTLNIKLKEDKKNGYFGKADMADATDGYYQGQFLFNKFKAKEKFSAYATLGNTGKTGLGWQDNQKYGSSDNITFGDDGGIYITGNSGDGLDSFNGQYNGQGIPLTRNGGLHYDSKWNSDKESINANYKAGSLEVNGNSNTLTQNNLPRGVQNGNSTQIFDNFMFRQKLDLTYQVKLDTTSNLKLSIDGTLKNTHTKSDYTSTTTSGNGKLLNNDPHNIDNKDNTQIFDASAFYTKKFKKKGRTLSFLASLSENQTTSKGFLKSQAESYDSTATGKHVSPIITDQYKTADVNSTVLKTNITYTEPLSKSFSAIFNYGFGINDGTSNLNTFNPSAPGVYTAKVDTLSNNYRLNELSNQVGAIFNYKKNKITLNFGTKVSNVNYNQTDEVTGNMLKRDFVNWAPQANFQYSFSQRQGVYINYQGSTVQPSISQIQPIVINTDPFNITVGNPNLTPSFTNRFSLSYNSYKVISGQYLYIYSYYSFTSDPIVSNLMTDSTGKTTNRYINLSSKKQSNYTVNIEFDQNIEKIDIRAGFNLGINGNNSYNLSNNEINLTNSVTYSLQAHLAKYAEKKYDTYVNFGPNYTFSSSSLQPEINNNGRGFDASWGFTFYLPAKFQAGTDGSYQWRGKTETFNTDFNRTLVNASIAKTFLKQDNLKLAVSANDLFNQNAGFTRNSSANFITQNTYSTIRRYFLVSITYDFNKMGGVTAKK
jgi:outer membrane receptor protein involved in Fe transport